MPNPTCPQPTVFADYSLGRLDVAASETLERHLDACPQCQAVLASGVSDPDPLLRAFPAAGHTRDPFETESQMQHGMDTVLQAGSGTVVGEKRETLDGPDIKQLRDYRIIRELGRGGMGAVYEAVHERLQRTVAVKVLAPGLVADQQARARFEREMKAVGRLDDPHIVRATDAGEESGMHYLVMEYVDGVDVSAFLQSGAMSVSSACEIIRQAALGLVTVHQHGLVHRDIKPGNLMVTQSGQVKLLDLGLALLQKSPLGDDGLTQTGQIMGTVDYMAPEQITNTHEVDARADLYSLGCVFYHLLSGRAPFADDSNPSAFEKLKFHLEREPADLSAIRSDIPDTVLRLLSQLQEKEPTRRNITPAELAAQLEPFTSGSALSQFVADATGQKRPALPMQSSVSLTGAETVDVAGRTELKPDVTKSRRSPRRILTAAISALVVLLGGVVYMATGEGAVEIRVNVADVTILIDDKPQQPGETKNDSGVITIRIPTGSGSHKVTVTKDGFARQSHTIRILRHLATPIEITLKPKTKPMPFFGHTESVLALDISDDGTRLISASADHTIRIWDVATGDHIRTMRGHEDDVRGVRFLQEENRALSASKDQTIRLWDVESGKLLRQYTGHTAMATAVSPSADGKAFLSSGFDGLLLWNHEQSTPVASLGYQAGDDVPSPGGMQDLKELKGHVTWVRSVEYSSDGALAVSAGNDGLAAIWDLESRTIRQHLIGHRAPVAVARFTPDASHVVTGGFDNRVLVFRADDGKLEKELTGHVAPVKAVALSNDGTRIATMAATRVIVWSAGDYQEEFRAELESDISAIVFAPTPETLIVGLANGSIRKIRIAKNHD